MGANGYTLKRELAVALILLKTCKYFFAIAVNLHIAARL